MKRFSKTICLALLVFTMIFALAGCSTAPKQDLGDIVPADVPAPVQEEAPAVEPAKEETPAVEPAKEEAPAVEPVQEEAPAEVAVTYVPVEKKYTLYGYELTVVADKGKATITYPASIIYKSDIDAAAKAAYEAFSSVYDLSGVRYSVEEDGVLTVTYPEAWGVEELAIAEKVVMEQLPAYVEYVVASLLSSAAEVVEAPAEEPVVEEAPVEEPVVEELGYARTINVFGYEATIEAYENIVEITYPSFITFDEVKAAAEVAYQAYEAYLAGSTLYVDSATGTAVLTLAGVPSSEDLDYAVDAIEVALPAYVASLFVEKVDEVVETVDEVVATVDEAIAAVPEVLKAAITVFGQNVEIVAEGNMVTISYPVVITNAEVAAAAKEAYDAYSQYLQGSTLTIDNGTAVLTLAYTLTEEDFYYAVNLVESELNYYVAKLFSEEKAEEIIETVTEVAQAITEAVTNATTSTEEAPAAEPAKEEAPAEEPAKEEAPAAEPAKEEAPAAEPAKEEAPAAEPAKTETTKPAETKTETTTTVAAEPAKKSNAGLIILIVVLVAVAAAAVVLFLKKKKN